MKDNKKSGKAHKKTEKKGETNDTCEDIEEYKKLAQKIQADFENYRKRMERERQEHEKFANERIVAEFLEVKDNLERALMTQENNESVIEGITLTLKQLDNILNKHGVIELDPLNQEFDPKYHEAMVAEDGDVQHETVADVLQKGYLLHSRVLRPAKVKIIKPKG